LGDFARLNREVDLEMDVTNKAKVLDSLKRNAVDFALVSILPEKMQVNKVDLVENKLYLVGNRESELESTNLKQLFKELPLIFRENGSGTRQVMESFIQRHHLLPRKKIELTTNEAVKQAVIAGLGFSIMPIIGIKSEVASGDIKVFPIKGLPIQTTWSLIWLKDKKLSPVAQAYLAHIQAHKQQISTRYFGSIDQ
jgi:DNA-binding transcriptional LysR family regulator